MDNNREGGNKGRRWGGLGWRGGFGGKKQKTVIVRQ